MASLKDNKLEIEVNQENKKSIFDQSWFWVALAIFFVLIFSNFAPSKISVKTNNLGLQIPSDLILQENLTPEQIAEYESRRFIEAVYYANADNSGIVLQELKFDFFTDQSLGIEYVRSSGLQSIGQFSKPLDFANGHHGAVGSDADKVGEISSHLYHYDKSMVDNNTTIYSSDILSTKLNRELSMVVSINNEPYLVKLTGKYYLRDNYILFVIPSGKEYHFYNFDDVFYGAMQAVKTNSNGYGTYYAKLDLSSVFTVYPYDAEANNGTGAFNLKNDVSTRFFNMAIFKFAYYETGAKRAEDSMFNQIACDREYTNVQYSIEFNSNGGIGEMSAVIGLENSDITIPQSDFLKAGKTFAGWNIEPDGTGIQYNVGDTITINDNTTLYAQWTTSVYSVQFTSIWGNGTMSAQTFTDGVSQTLNACTLTRANYQFSHWFLFWNYDYVVPDDAEITITSIIENDVEKIKVICGANEYIIPNTTKMTLNNGTQQQVANDDIHNIALYDMWTILDYIGTYSTQRASVLVGENGIESVTLDGITYTDITNKQNFFNNGSFSASFGNAEYGVGISQNANGYKLRIVRHHQSYTEVVIDGQCQFIGG